MKTRTRELAKPGIYGTVDNPIIVSEKELREIAETFSDIKKAPVSLNGHWPDASKPRLGNVVSVTFDETKKTLLGTVEEHDNLAQAVEEGFFPDVSIGGKRRASDGKMYLHHLAYLGEEPPAVKNLISDILENLNPDDEIAASDRAGVIRLPSHTSHQLVLSDPILSTMPSNEGTKKEPKEEPMRTLEEAEAELKAEKENTAKLTAEVEKMKVMLEELAEKYPDEGIALSDADPRVSRLMTELRQNKRDQIIKKAEGKLPKGKEGVLLALADSLTTSQSLELSDGQQKKKVSQLDVLGEFLDILPSPVKEGRMDLSDGNSTAAVVDMTKLMNKV